MKEVFFVDILFQKMNSPGGAHRPVQGCLLFYTTGADHHWNRTRKTEGGIARSITIDRALLHHFAVTRSLKKLSKM